MRPHYLRSLPLAALILVGCGSSTSTGGDAANDTATTSDSASDTPIAADANDAGNGSTDAGNVFDAGNTDDAGNGSTDAGNVFDAGSTDDAGNSSTDAGHPPVDAGDPFTDAGALGEPAWVDVDVRTTTTCDPLVKCGGDVVGTWDVTGVCIEVPLGALLNQCTTARVTYAGGHARGRVTFDGTIARRVAQADAEVDLFIPAVCASFAGGCPGVESALRAQAPDSACTMASTGDCNCVSRTQSTIDDTDGYSLANDEIVSATLHKHWAYCIAGDAFTYQDTSPSGTREPGIIQLGRRQ